MTTEQKTEQTKEQPYIVWDTSEILQRQVEYIMETAEDDNRIVTEEEAWNEAAQDSYLFEDEWEYLIESLTAAMNEINPSGAWYAIMKDFGWRKANGYKLFVSNDGSHLLKQILPDTDCTFKIYKREGCLAINNAHHDSCTWDEWYYIYPAKQCWRCDEVLLEEHAIKIVDSEDVVCEYCATYYDDEDLVKP